MTTATSDISVDVEHKPGSMVELRVEAPASDLDQALVGAVRRIGSRLRIPGFRPGKAPAPVVERIVGWDRIQQEAADDLIPLLYNRALEQAAIEPIGDPHVHVDALERGEPVRFHAEITVAPAVDLGDYASLRVERQTTEVGEEQVEAAILEVRRRLSEIAAVERPAQAGDLLRAVLVMHRGEEILSNPERSEQDLDLDRDKLIDGLVDGVVGLTAGEQRTFPLTLPQEHPKEELRGVGVDVDIEVREVRERILPDLTDDLAKRDEHGETVDEMREWYRNELVSLASREDNEHFEGEVLGALRELVKIDVPEVMLDRELNRQVAEMEARLSGLGMQFEKYLEITGGSLAQFKAERHEAGEARVKLELALDALAVAEEIEVDDSQVQREVERIAEDRKVSAAGRRRLERAARNDLVRRAAAERAMEIALGEV
ncbi:MAG: trigger factor [Candidatus Dormibacteria bacterium]